MSHRSGRRRSRGRTSSSGSCSGSTSGDADDSPSLKQATTSNTPLPKPCFFTPTSPSTFPRICAASSPGRTAIIQTRTPVARQLRFSMARTNWNRDTIEFFVGALVDECRVGNRPHKTLNRLGKANVVRRMKDHTGQDWTWDICKHTWEDLKKKWSCWKQLTKFSGIAFHPGTGVIDMPSERWDKQIEANKVAKYFQQNRLEFEEQLDYIFKKQEPVNVGPTEPGGHEGGKAGVPTQHLDSENSDESDDELPIQLPTEQPSQPMRTTSMTSASSGKRKLSDPMVASAHFWEGFKNYYHDISTSKKQQETSSSSKQAEEDLEYEELMMKLLEAGISPTSEEYFMASVVLIDIHRQGAYRPLPTIEAKVTWIKRMYQFIIGQPPSM